MNGSALEWSDNFSTDIMSIDRQHQELLFLLQKLLDVLSREDATLEDTQRVYQDLVDHALEHFDYEERIMKNIGYPDRKAHAAEHKDLRAQIDAITQDVMHGDGKSDWKGLVSLVQVWLLRHIVSTDTKIRDFIQNGKADD